MDAAAYLAKISEQAFFADENTVGSLRWYISWYQTRAPVRRWLFRASGVTVIVVSVSLPFFLSLLPEVDRASAAVIAAWIIALVGGLNGFFSWDKVWQSYMEAQLKLDGIRTIWEVQSTLLVASGRPDAVERLDELAKSTVTEALNAVIQETRGYFSQVKFPDTKPRADAGDARTTDKPGAR